MKNITYPVNELFHSIQGEGGWAGTASIFLRLQGCAVGCPWCDTRYTWILDPLKQIKHRLMTMKPKEFPEWSSSTTEQILDWCAQKAPNTRHLVLTGGEPLASPHINDLIEAAHSRGFTVQVETSGTEDVLSLPDYTWVTLSPKFGMPGGLQVNPACFFRANEVKLPLSGRLHERGLVEFVMGAMQGANSCAPLYLQPLSKGKQATDQCVSLALEYGLRVSVQTHKYIGLR